jgi:hypothetical protein
VEDRLDYRFTGFIFHSQPNMMTQGVNEHGLCLAYAWVKIKLPGWEADWEENVPGATAPQRKSGEIGQGLLGRCKTVGEAVHLVLSQCEDGDHLGGSLLMADPTSAVIIEAAGDDFEIRRFRQGVDVRTNHFLRLPELGPNRNDYPSSYSRRTRALELLASKRMIQPETLMEVLGDHMPEPSEDTICRHPADTNDPMAHFTLASSILIPRNADGRPEIQHAAGNPCSAPFDRYVLR